MLGILVVLNLINASIIFSFMNAMYQKSYSGKSAYIGAFIVFCFIHIAVNSWRIPALNMLVTIFSIHVLGKVMYEDLERKSAYNLLFALYLIFMDSAVFAAMSVLLLQPLMNMILLEHYVAIGTILQYMLVICTYKLLIRHFLKDDSKVVRITQNLFFALLAIFQIGVMSYLWHVQANVAPFFVMLISIGFVLVDIYLVYFFKVIHENEIIFYKMDLLEQQRVILNQGIQDMYRREKNFRKVDHDIRGQMSLIQGLFIKGAVESAELLKVQLNETLDKLNEDFICEEPILNILFNDRLKAAQNLGIKVDFQVRSDIAWSFIREIDRTALFLNLLNNAVEACASVTEGEKFIKLKIAVVQNNIVIQVSNSFAPNYLTVKDGYYQSTKPGHSGIGMGNIRSIVEKYGGCVEFRIEGSVFIAGMFIPLLAGAAATLINDY